MSAELYAVDGAGRPGRPEDPVPAAAPVLRGRPTVSGDLPTVLSAAPMFRRAVTGYDRFEVDTYVQWAEDELATADREREHLIARTLRTQAALEEARELLAHSPDGGEFLHLSRRIGSMLAVAADQATSMRAEAQAEAAAASVEAAQVVARAERVLADASAGAGRVLAEAGARVREMTAAAEQVVAEAQRTRTAADAVAAGRLAEVRSLERRALEDAERVRQQAAAAAAAARLQARGEILGMLTTGRAERSRADAAAAAVRNRLDEEALARRTVLLTDVATLEQRRSALRSELELLAAALAEQTGDRFGVRLHRLLGRFRGPSAARPASRSAG